MNKKRYIENRGNHCPFCDTDSVTGLQFESDADVVWRLVVCDKCDKYWNDIYKLVDVEEVQ